MKKITKISRTKNKVLSYAEEGWEQRYSLTFSCIFYIVSHLTQFQGISKLLFPVKNEKETQSKQ